MTLSGFKAKNHPQQTALFGPRDDIDDRAITPEDFAPLHERFQFTIDAAAAEHNARLPRYWTRADDALAQSWAGERVWCNPPYSDIAPWITKAWHAHTWGCALTVMLLPANRTEQQWWQRGVECHRDNGSGLSVEFLAGRMRFLRRGATEVKPNERPPFGCCLLIWRPL